MKGVGSWARVGDVSVVVVVVDDNVRWRGSDGSVGWFVDFWNDV